VLDEDKKEVNEYIDTKTTTNQSLKQRRIDAVVTDIDGTLTDNNRLINIAAIEKIRWLTSQNVPVILASGNTACLMHGVSRFFGSSGTFIAENGGVYRIGFLGPVMVCSPRDLIFEAFEYLRRHYENLGTPLNLYSYHERFSDIAFEKTMPTEEIMSILAHFDTNITVLDTSFAIHLQKAGINKGETLKLIAKEMGLSLPHIVAIGDSINDIEMISSVGYGACVGNSTPELKSAATYCASAAYGDGFVEIIDHFFDTLS
jgi:phosphoglycolate phosphatase (TIGR01487 family)